LLIAGGAQELYECGQRIDDSILLSVMGKERCQEE